MAPRLRPLPDTALRWIRHPRGKTACLDVPQRSPRPGAARWGSSIPLRSRASRGPGHRRNIVSQPVEPHDAAAGVPGCAAPTVPLSANPADAVPRTSRRGFLRTGGMLSLSSLMGTATLMAAPNDAKAAVEWAEHFQKNYRLMTAGRARGIAAAAGEALFGRVRQEGQRRHHRRAARRADGLCAEHPQVHRLPALRAGLRRRRTTSRAASGPASASSGSRCCAWSAASSPRSKMDQGYPEGLGIQVGGNAYTPAGVSWKGSTTTRRRRCPRRTPPTCRSPACSARSRPA